jgi:signal transduction histidine kinase
MHRTLRLPFWLLAWALLTLAGGTLLARAALERERAAFETDARIVHRLLSQRAVEHDAVLSMLALLQPAAEAGGEAVLARLPAVVPQVLSVQRSDAATPWASAGLRSAQERSRQTRRPVLAEADLAAGAFVLVMAADPASYALRIGLRTMVPWSEWPAPPENSPVAMALEWQGQRHVLQPGRVAGSGWTYAFHKHLATDSQPFDVVAQRVVGWAELPWLRMAGLAIAVAAVLSALHWLLRQQAARRRAEELLRLGQVTRLNALGELAAGMAHELNQPLAALLANTQAARRLVEDDPPDLATARHAMAQASEQARRASDVVGRLRRAVERPDVGARLQSVDLQQAVHNALYLLEPELRRRGVAPQVQATAEAVHVLADPVALEQIVHNLLLNALQALEQTPAGERRLALSLERTPEHGSLAVQDSGPGLAPEVLPRVFEPFFSTRQGGLGLGLSLCESLASGMGGSLVAANAAVRGAVFRLALPLAGGAARSAVP